jgi:hypothetical protein
VSRGRLGQPEFRRLFQLTTIGLDTPEGFVHGCSDEGAAATDAREHIDVAKLGIFQFDLDFDIHAIETLTNYT